MFAVKDFFKSCFLKLHYCHHSNVLDDIWKKKKILTILTTLHSTYHSSFFSYWHNSFKHVKLYIEQSFTTSTYNIHTQSIFNNYIHIDHEVAFKPWSTYLLCTYNYSHLKLDCDCIPHFCHFSAIYKKYAYIFFFIYYSLKSGSLF